MTGMQTSPPAEELGVWGRGKLVIGLAYHGNVGTRAGWAREGKRRVCGETDLERKYSPPSRTCIRWYAVERNGDGRKRCGQSDSGGGSGEGADAPTMTMCLVFFC